MAEVLPAGTPPSQPYWLREEGTAGLFRVDDPALIGRPENPPAFPVEYVFEVGGQTLVVSGEPVAAMGSVKPAARRRLEVIPPVSIRFVSSVQLFAPGDARPVTVEVTGAATARRRHGGAGSPRRLEGLARRTPFRLGSRAILPGSASP